MDINLKKILNQLDKPEVDSYTRNLSKKFLEKYWLSLTEFNKYWLPIKSNIFSSNSKYFPDSMFNEGFELIAQRGGILFTEEEYHILQGCMKIAGDKHFVLIENEFKRNIKGDFPHLRFKFPIDTTWEELNNGDEDFLDISFETIFVDNKHFFVYSDSGKWGKYAASDYNYTPIDIIGFKPELASVFRERYKQPKEEQDEIRNWLPQNYKNLIDC